MNSIGTECANMMDMKAKIFFLFAVVQKDDAFIWAQTCEENKCKI